MASEGAETEQIGSGIPEWLSGLTSLSDSSEERCQDTPDTRSNETLDGGQRLLTHSDAAALITRQLHDLNINEIPIANARVVITPHQAALRGVDGPGKASLVPFELDYVPSELFACSQSSNTTAFSITTGQRTLDLYFDPESDNLVLESRDGCDPFELVSLNGSCKPMIVPPNGIAQLAPGPWRILVKSGSARDHSLFADLMVFGRRYAVHMYDAVLPAAGSKHKDHEELETERPKRPRTSGSDLSKAARPTYLKESAGEGLGDKAPRLQLVKAGNPLSSLEPGKGLIVRSDRPLPQCGEDNYGLECRRRISGMFCNATVISAKVSDCKDAAAVKTIQPRRSKPRQLQTPALAREWENETRIMRELNHPSIIRFLGADARFLSISMELVQHPDLTPSPLTKDNMFPGTYDDAERILRDMASALEYLETKGVVHNDIKPSNILYEYGRGAVLIDFGSASTRATEGRNGGTKAYITVEEYQQDRPRGHPGDIYALGVTMLYALRKTPLPEYELIRLRGLERWCQRVNSLRETLVGSRLESVVAKMLAEEPQQRISVREILQELGDPCSKVLRGSEESS